MRDEIDELAKEAFERMAAEVRLPDNIEVPLRQLSSAGTAAGSEIPAGIRKSGGGIGLAAAAVFAVFLIPLSGMLPQGGRDSLRYSAEQAYERSEKERFAHACTAFFGEGGKALAYRQ